MASLRRMTSNIAAQIFALAASLLDRILLVGLLLRHWGADVFADYSVIQSAASLLLIAEFGIQIYFQNAEQAAFVNGDKPKFRRFAAIHLSTILCLVVALVVALSLVTGAGATDGWFHLNRIDAATARQTLWLLGLGNLLTIVRSTTTAIYSAMGDFAFTVVMTAVALIVNTVAAIASVELGGGPVAVSVFFLGVSGAGSLAFFLWDVRRRYGDWVPPPAWPMVSELRQAFVHLKWFSLQVIGPIVWLQAPTLIFDGAGVSGREITSFLLIRTMVNQIRQAFQFATIGVGIEIAPLAHRGDLEGAWRLSAEVGLMTTALCGALVAAILVFGPDVTRVWAGDASLFSLPIAIALLAPLLAVVFLQQPLAMLQYSNVSRPPGLQRLAQIVLGPAFCVIGEKIYGVVGLVVGLAISEVIANWALLPMLARMKMFSNLAGYCLQSAAVAAVSTLAGFGIGLALTREWPPSTVPALMIDLGLWALLALTPVLAATLPPHVRDQMFRRLGLPWRVRSG